MQRRSLQTMALVLSTFLLLGSLAVAAFKDGTSDQRIVVWTDFRHKENGKWVYVFRHAHWPLASNSLPDAKSRRRAQRPNRDSSRRIGDSSLPTLNGRFSLGSRHAALYASLFPGAPEARELAVVVRCVPPTGRHADVSRTSEPGAAAQRYIVGVIPVARPLPDVPQHVV
jgi:hypothetical protein